MIETIPTSLAGERLDRVVAMLTGCSRAQAAELIAAGSVLLDGVVARGKDKVDEGQVVDVAQTPDVGPVLPEAQADIVVPVVYADEHLIVINKPAGLVVHPAHGHDNGTVVNGLLAMFPELADVGSPQRPGIVHRLDSGTTGLLVVARRQDAYESLTAQLAGRTMTRTYLALVWGWFEHRSGTIDAPIGRDPKKPLRRGIVPDGKPARTGYDVVETFSHPAEVSSLRCKLETGRTHQIRVHLEAVGHPVIGDPVYRNRRRRQEILADRPLLHAAELAMQHPATGELIAFSAPLPFDMQTVMMSLS